MPTDGGARAHRIEPEWDEAREGRVLAAVRRARLAPRRRPLRSAIALGVAVAVGATVALVLARWPSPHTPETASARPSAVADAHSPRWTLPDGSVAWLSPGADVEIETYDSTRITVLQRWGEARYEVRYDPRRRFVVHALGVRVEVVGTRFILTVTPEGLRVRVEEGIVRVDDGRRSIDLSAGADEVFRAVNRTTGRDATTEPPAATPPATAMKRIAGSRARTVSPVEQPPDLDALFADIDRARREGRFDDAAGLLTRAVTVSPADPRTASALFVLGLVERRRGHHEAAAAAFRACRARELGGSLAEDALAEEAEALAAAGRTADARDAARLYLTRYPRGTHVSRIGHLAE